MRLLLHSRLRPETVDRLLALSPHLDVVDVSADRDFDLDALEDPALEVIIGRRAPADLTKVPRLRWLPNVTITPHVSGATTQFRDELVVENVRRYLAGEPLLNPVDPVRGY